MEIKETYKFETEPLLTKCKAIRKNMITKQCIIVSNLDNPKVKDYLINFTNCCYNRMLDIFDDTIYLLDKKRIPSACTISRAMIETHSFLVLTIDNVNKILEKKETNRVEIINTILKSINSSKFKYDDQTKVKNKIIKIEDYNFTPSAQERMLNEESVKTHVNDALKHLYKLEIENGRTTEIKTEAHSEHLYNLLSEWGHPSQISLFTNYANDTHKISCSLGIVDILDLAEYLCIQALDYIDMLEKNYKIILNLAKTLPE